MEEVKPIGADVSGFEILTNAVLSLLSHFPGLNGRVILFEELGTDSGIAFSANSGALIMTERRSITDHVVQQCQYPFYIVYRTASIEEYQKLQVQAFFDAIGKWLCREPAVVNGETVRLRSFPALTDGRRITRITRSNSYGLEANENGVQDWLLPVTVEYTNEFDMW